MRFSAPMRVHFVGISGVGMSAIAKVLLERGFTISGSDLKRSRASLLLEAMGAEIHVGHDADNIAGADAVVVSSAIPVRNVEVVAARDAGIEVMTRGDALAALVNDAESVIVAGTHGKTTTTSMIVSVLRSAAMDPTYLVGGGLNDSGTNARSGTGPLVAESDESDGSFLLLRPSVAVVTNVDADHLDHWGSIANIRGAFQTFLSTVTATAVVPVGESMLVEACRAIGVRTITFGEGGDVTAADQVLHGNGSGFTLRFEGRSSGVHLSVPGGYNVANALAAAGGCIAAGLDLEQIAHGLSSFHGVERRFQVRGSARGVTVVDDYAHNPSKVKAVLSAAKLGSEDGRWAQVVAVFQPHRYSRTRSFYQDFGCAFADADRVVVTDIYGAGEEPVPGVTGKLVADAVCARLPGRPVAYLPHRNELLDYLEHVTRRGDVLLTLGAGDITTVGEEFLSRRGARWI
ncbi:MAG: UDP-N-acetylmuramate--L-alanine ligase [Actinomycetota bacterium]|nr:UDP-N-acetylmuramate--L-alanine ligase [Actinomycetota bacterium]